MSCSSCGGTLLDKVMETPSQTLASKILQRLADQKLVIADDIRQLAPKLATGTLRSEDWRLAVEKATEKKGAK
jgi:hypothetical protein